MIFRQLQGLYLTGLLKGIAVKNSDPFLLLCNICVVSPGASIQKLRYQSPGLREHPAKNILFTERGNLEDALFHSNLTLDTFPFVALPFFLPLHSPLRSIKLQEPFDRGSSSTNTVLRTTSVLIHLTLACCCSVGKN